MLSAALIFQAFQRRVVLLIVAVLWLIVGCAWAARKASDRYSYHQTQQLKKYHIQTGVWNEDKKPHEN
ncbi:hypothetical protein NIES4075_68290 [Tolypothrix sp. NIES-4075]|nr:hypothetical protein NIES4075_68290 [Tolypothrix sp. NIES-4075]